MKRRNGRPRPISCTASAEFAAEVPCLASRAREAALPSAAKVARATRHHRRDFVYLAAAYLLVGRGLLGDSAGRIVSNGAGHDPSVMIWSLAWFPHALANHLDVFYSRAVWWPVGIDLAWMTSIPGAALLAWPITSGFGPVASFNALSFIALPTAAFTGFLLCRHVTGRNRASLLGGYVFGLLAIFPGSSAEPPAADTGVSDSAGGSADGSIAGGQDQPAAIR